MSSALQSKPGQPVRKRRQFDTESPERAALRLSEIRKREMAYNKARFLEALESKMGMVTYACKALGLHPQTVYTWMDGDPELVRKINLIRERKLDFVEMNMLKIIESDAPHNAAPRARLIAWFLSCQGAARGYSSDYARGRSLMRYGEEGEPEPVQPALGPPAVGEEDYGEKMTEDALVKALAIVNERVPEVLKPARGRVVESDHNEP
jgi:hypothetical protein